MSTFQVQHACAGGTLALLSVSSLLAVGGREEDTAIVCGSDIAHYRGSSTAEITQGAGAAALHVGASPRLIELDLGAVGYHSQDVDDFFRPLGQKFPEVKGGYSIQCYNNSLQAAFADACERQGKDAAAVLGETAVIALHTPFRNLPNLAMTRLLKHHLGLDERGSVEFLEQRGFYAGIDPVSLIGTSIRVRSSSPWPSRSPTRTGSPAPTSSERESSSVHTVPAAPWP
jgi:hydroxymethylglutaryl-CoA synthase